MGRNRWCRNKNVYYKIMSEFYLSSLIIVWSGIMSFAVDVDVNGFRNSMNSAFRDVFLVGLVFTDLEFVGMVMVIPWSTFCTYYLKTDFFFPVLKFSSNISGFFLLGFFHDLFGSYRFALRAQARST